MSDKLVISHAECSDGLCSAWLFHRKFPDATFHFARYGSSPPDVSGKEVYMTDFSYPRDVLLDMKSKAKSIQVLDHHKSAREALDGLDFCLFDMDRSGAGLSWDYLHPGKERHWIAAYTEDYDLWRFKLPYSREINAALQSYPMTFDALYELEERSGADGLIAEGEAILRSKQQMVTEICSAAREVDVQGYKVLMANTLVCKNEAANYLAKGRAFGITWFENEKGERVFSFRAKEESGTDLTKIVAKYKGGGHKLAAGARLLPGQDL